MSSPDSTVLRRTALDHAQWLRDFALVMETTPEKKGIPMTPFRAGCVGRLRLAADHIEQLQAEVVDLKREMQSEDGR
jgi:hypothetical protein